MFEEILAKLGKSLHDHRVPYMIIGGQAVLIYGEPRLTRDIDVTLGLEPSRAYEVLSLVRELALRPLPDNPLAFVEKTMVLPTLDDRTGIRVDFIFSFTPYEQYKPVINAHNSLAYLKTWVIAQLSLFIILRLKPQCPPCVVLISFIAGLRHISSAKPLIFENGMILSSFDEIIRVGMLILIISFLPIVKADKYEFTLEYLKCGNKVSIIPKGESHFMHSEKSNACGNAICFFLRVFFQIFKRYHLYNSVVFIFLNASNGFKTGEINAAPATFFIKDSPNSLSSLMIIFPPKENPNKNILLSYNSDT